MCVCVVRSATLTASKIEKLSIERSYQHHRNMSIIYDKLDIASLLLTLRCLAAVAILARYQLCRQFNLHKFTVAYYGLGACFIAYSLSEMIYLEHEN